MKFGQKIKERRLELGLNLRKFCLNFGHDPSNWSKLERGILPPPNDEKTLERYANDLEIPEGSSQWMEFFDSAFLDRGNIPPYIRANPNIMEKLPLFFRTVSGQKPTEAELDQLADLLKNQP